MYNSWFQRVKETQAYVAYGFIGECCWALNEFFENLGRGTTSVR
jgi:hypothetical protein